MRMSHERPGGGGRGEKQKLRKQKAEMGLQDDGTSREKLKR
jgi:hypothetical protein